MENKDEKKVEKVLQKVGVSKVSEIINTKQLGILIDNLSKLPKESLQQLVDKIPDFSQLSTRYLDDIKLSHEKYSDRLEREMDKLYELLEKDIKGLDKSDILQEIRRVRRLLWMERLMYSKEMKAVYTAGVAVASVVATSMLNNKKN
jgi:hypothetical protein